MVQFHLLHVLQHLAAWQHSNAGNSWQPGSLPLLILQGRRPRALRPSGGAFFMCSIQPCSGVSLSCTQIVPGTDMSFCELADMHATMHRRRAAPQQGAPLEGMENVISAAPAYPSGDKMIRWFRKWLHLCTCWRETNTSNILLRCDAVNRLNCCFVAFTFWHLEGGCCSAHSR